MATGLAGSVTPGIVWIPNRWWRQVCRSRIQSSGSAWSVDVVNGAANSYLTKTSWIQTD